MSQADELRSLAQDLKGAAWREKSPNDWTADERAAYSRASRERKLAYVDALLHRLLTVHYLQLGEEPPTDLPPDSVIIPSCDVAEFEAPRP